MDPDQVPGYFYPRSPCGERQVIGQVTIHSIHISIHALLAESDAEIAKTSNADTKFLSTLSLRRATIEVTLICEVIADFYPRSPCGERPPPSYNLRIHQNFYPRSPCGERLHAPNHNPCRCNISIHALLAESDLLKNHIIFHYNLFLSTLSLRRATEGPNV